MHKVQSMMQWCNVAWSFCYHSNNIICITLNDRRKTLQNVTKVNQPLLTNQNAELDSTVG